MVGSRETYTGTSTEGAVQYYDSPKLWFVTYSIGARIGCAAVVVRREPSK